MKPSSLIPLMLLALVAALPAQEAERAAPAEKKAPQEAKADPALEAWIQTLSKRIADQHPEIKRSAQQGLVSMGKKALPALKKHAAGGDPAVAAEAKRLVARIERGGNRQQGRRQGRRGNWGANFAERLKLDEAQTKKYEALQNDNRQQMRDLFQEMRDGELSREEFQAARSELQQEMNKKLKDMLSAEQFAEYEKARSEMRGRFGRGGRRGGRGGGEGGQGGRRRRGGGGGDGGVDF